MPGLNGNQQLELIAHGGKRIPPDTNYYAVLCVAKTSTDIEIKSAYRDLAVKYHPDLNPDDRHAEDMFKAIAEAYGILSDPEKRRAYDEFGQQGLIKYESIVLLTMGTLYGTSLKLYGYDNMYHYVVRSDSYMRLTIESGHRHMYLGNARRNLLKLKFVPDPPRGVSWSMQYLYTMDGNNRLHSDSIRLKNVPDQVVINKWTYDKETAGKC